MASRPVPSASAARILTQEQVRAFQRSQAVRFQKQERDSRVLARRLDRITQLGSGLSLDQSSDEEKEEVANVMEKKPSVVQGSVEAGVGQQEPADGKTTKARKSKRSSKKQEALSNVLTYAHLFTLSPLIASPPLPTADDLRESYLALGPIPNGKRCLLVTGPKGSSSSPTTLHNRVSARVLLRWVSPLPGGTILDCLLPDDWKTTGILQIVDCLKWKEMEIASSGAFLRQFFLQSRLAELPPSPSPPSTSMYKNPTHFRPLSIVSPPISTDMWASLRSMSLKAGEGVMILHSEGTYVFGDEKDGDGEAWWVGPEEVEDLLAVASGHLLSDHTTTQEDVNLEE